VVPSSSHDVDPKCPKRRAYHTILTTQASIYQQWQSRIMYYHWRKQAAIDGPCTDMANFTRLVASEEGKSDGLEMEMPSVFVRQYTTAEIAKYGHFGVLNRPFSVQQFIDGGHLARIREAFVYIAETDHVLMKPLPNLATDTMAAAFSFGYMHSSASVQRYIDLVAAGTSWRDVQPVGPSPLMMKKADLERVTPRWLDYSLALKLNKDADARFGWALEMWGYSIAAASLGIKHDVLRNFQVEGGAGISASNAQSRGTYIFHYTYGLEYTLGGRPQGPNQIGEWSLDKRHYGGAYPPRNLQRPPASASDGTVWLLEAFNEASANIAAWPQTRALGTVGWRRNKGEGIKGSSLAAKVLGSRWKWAGISGLQFLAAGELKTPWGSGVWGALPSGVDYRDDGFCAKECLFADFGGGLHNVRFDQELHSFKSYRLGDGDSINGEAEQ